MTFQQFPRLRPPPPTSPRPETPAPAPGRRRRHPLHACRRSRRSPPPPPPPAPVRVAAPMSNSTPKHNCATEQAKKQDISIRDLQRMEIEALHKMAHEEGIADYTGLKKQDLVFQILKSASPSKA